MPVISPVSNFNTSLLKIDYRITDQWKIVYYRFLKIIPSWLL